VSDERVCSWGCCFMSPRSEHPTDPVRRSKRNDKAMPWILIPGERNCQKVLFACLNCHFLEKAKWMRRGGAGTDREEGEREKLSSYYFLLQLYNISLDENKRRRQRDARRMKIVLKDFLRLNKFFLSLISFSAFRGFLCCFFLSLDYGEVFFRVFAKSA
jgi:hypothetical protein